MSALKILQQTVRSKMIVKLTLAGMIALPFLFTACEEELDYHLNTNENKRLVVEGSITNHPNREDTVRLSWTTDYFSEEKSTWINDALVRVYDDQGESQILKNTGKGRYITNRDSMAIGPGKTYHLSVEYQGETYDASDEMHSIVEIDSIKWYYQYYKLADDTFYQFSYYGPESPEQGNNYMWLVYLNNNLATDTLREVLFQEDDAVNGQYINGIDLYWFFDETVKRYAREKKQISADSTVYFYPDTIQARMEMFSISENYLGFLYSAMAETAWNTGLFSAPPANVPSNVSNNALGYFYAAAVTDYEFTIIRSERNNPEHKRN